VGANTVAIATDQQNKNEAYLVSKMVTGNGWPVASRAGYLRYVALAWWTTPLPPPHDQLRLVKLELNYLSLLRIDGD